MNKAQRAVHSGMYDYKWHFILWIDSVTHTHAWNIIFWHSSIYMDDSSTQICPGLLSVVHRRLWKTILQIFVCQLKNNNWIKEKVLRTFYCRHCRHCSHKYGHRVKHRELSSKIWILTLLTVNSSGSKSAKKEYFNKAKHLNISDIRFRSVSASLSLNHYNTSFLFNVEWRCIESINALPYDFLLQ